MTTKPTELESYMQDDLRIINVRKGRGLKASIKHHVKFLTKLYHKNKLKPSHYSARVGQLMELLRTV